jgi:hypothetical protein
MTADFHVRIDISHAKRGLDRLHPAVVSAVDQKLWRGAEEVARTGKENAPKAFSNLTNSIRAERVESMHFQVSENMNYGRAVEEGGRPHWVNSEKLVPWVERVLGLRDKDARSTAFRIARAIAMRGTRKQPYMQPAAESKAARVHELVLAGVEQGSRWAFDV